MNLPGSIHKAFIEDKCQNHPDRQAVVNVQGETDSMGCELHPFCQVCYDEYLAAKAVEPPMIGVCDFCHEGNQPLRPTRDYDEGMSGPVYYVCQPCRRKQEQDAIQELQEMAADVEVLEIDDYPEDENADF